MTIPGIILTIIFLTGCSFLIGLGLIAICLGFGELFYSRVGTALPAAPIAIGYLIAALWVTRNVYMFIRGML